MIEIGCIIRVSGMKSTGANEKADLDLYLSGLYEDKRTVLAAWSELSPYRTLMPVTIRSVEKRLYLGDLKALLELMGNEHGVVVPGPDA